MKIELKNQRTLPLPGDLLVLKEQDSETKFYFLFIIQHEEDTCSTAHPIIEREDREKYLINLKDNTSELVGEISGYSEPPFIETKYTKKRYIIHQIVSKLEIREI